ncbi:probable L-type lectin-domain containing receptor kinase S.5 [Ziziphus jujuba]|uniref:Probable L-type lectin-domain containing receptor kinase S.5 n=1 Tax=Ziziphus jujuba TaxID=326968 RepID=A0ABM3ZWY0_ZIZJJ|nr:probable L-type lectin-domain containing receptor kinase S.5 [Ziziphus jujuba]
MPLKQSLLIALWLCFAAFAQVGCLNFSYPTFQREDEESLLLYNSYVVFGAIQVTPDVSSGPLITDMSGRALSRKPFKLWRKGKGNSRIIASFNSTFVINITPKTVPGGEGLAFILTGNTIRPENSEGKWLGIVNANTNGSSQAKIVAIEFDTRKSYEEDIDDNHVGLDVHSIYSKKQVPLIDYGVNLSTGSNITVKVEYDGKNISVFVTLTNETAGEMKNPVLTMPLDLSDLLPEKTYVGFSASTGIHTQLNCILSWDFHSTNISENPNLLWVWITVPGIVALLGGGAAFYMYWIRKRDRENLEDAYPGIEEEIQGYSMGPKKFRLKELRRATGKFDLKNMLGNGGFGTVYKGVLGNQDVAVKRISKNSRQGKQEFISEVTTIGSLRHKNLVKLIGWCYERHELIIVYEYMPNRSLDKYIFSDDQKLGMNVAESMVLSWERRHRIIYGVAQALDYLHNGCEKRVLHRDIKSSNIMLDSEFNAKLGDFGLARTIQQSEKTHHTTKEIAGTPGYMAPESFLIGRATVETDVYAFGVLVLVVVCGRKPGYQNENSYNNSIVLWVWDLYNKGRILSAVDSRLEDFDRDEIIRVLILGLACCHPNPHQRPSMKTVSKVLTGEADPPLVSTEIPSFVWPPMPSFSDYTETGQPGGQITPFTELTGR